MSKITDAEANATSLDGLVNDNALVPTLRNGPKPSYQYLVDGWNTEFNTLIDNLDTQGDAAIVAINEDVATVDNAATVALSSINTNKETIETAAANVDLTIAELDSKYKLTMLGVDGAWASGIEFTAYNQYLVYNGTAYQPKPSTNPPYTTGAIPNLSDVQPITVNNADGIILDGGGSVQDYIDGQQFASVDAVKSYSKISKLMGQRIQTKEYHAGTGYGGATYIVAPYADNPQIDNIGNGFISDVDSSICVVNLSKNVIVSQYGARPDDITIDSYQAIQAAFDEALRLSNVNSTYLTAALQTNFPAIPIVFEYGQGYRLSQPVDYSHTAFEMVGYGRVHIKPDNFNDFPFKFNGTAFAHKIHGFTFECTQAGVFDYESTNTSGGLVEFEKCRFVSDPYGFHSGIAIRYRNRSSELRLSNIYFNRVKHPVHNRECDFVTFNDNCWFGFPFYSVFDDRDGYIRNDNGFMRIDNCLFAGGPSDTPVGTNAGTGTGAANGAEVAYIRCGTEAVSPDITEVHGRISITNTRIGYEQGAGALVNFFTPYQTSGTHFRSGIYIADVQTSPREDKIPNFEGLDVSPVLRLFTAPSEIVIDGLYINPSNTALISNGSTTTLEALRGQLNDPVNYSDDFADQGVDKKAFWQYSAKNVCGENVFMVASQSAPSKLENNKWLELFDSFNYFFESDFPLPTSAGNSPTIKVETFFNDFSTQGGSIFNVYGDCYPAVAGGNINRRNISGTITILHNEATNTITGEFYDTSGISASMSITVLFDVGGVESASVTLAQAANATLLVKLTNAAVDGANIRCRGLVVKPVSAYFDDRQNGFYQA